MEDCEAEETNGFYDETEESDHDEEVVCISLDWLDWEYRLIRSI